MHNGDLTNFTRSLSNNQLTGSIPAEFGNSSIRHLYISNNQITGKIPLSFQYSEIESLAVGGNILADVIPDVVNWTMPSLEFLDLSDSPIQTTLATQISKLQQVFPNLQQLYELQLT
jgi:Leucine-rich repeat (LRR) protein